MVVDLKKFEPKQRLAPGLLWVVEQVGGVVAMLDAWAAVGGGAVVGALAAVGVAAGGSLYARVDRQ
eukprot:209424-Pelagomonas_calceolata.AAC.1